MYFDVSESPVDVKKPQVQLSFRNLSVLFTRKCENYKESFKLIHIYIIVCITAAQVLI